MKTLLLMLILFTSYAFCSDELSWVDEQVEAIKPSRIGMDYSTLTKLSNPFIFLDRSDKKEQKSSVQRLLTTNSAPKSIELKVQKQVLSLFAILNSSAMINQKWYKKGDEVNGYTIQEIYPKSVLLSKDKKQLLLSTRSISKNLKFHNK